MPLIVGVEFAAPDNVPVQSSKRYVPAASAAPLTLIASVFPFRLRLPATLILPITDGLPPMPVKVANAPEFKVVVPPMGPMFVVALASVAVEATVTAEAPIEPPLNASVPALTAVLPV